MGYLSTHPLPSPGNLGKQPDLPKKSLSHLLHTASADLPLPKMKCGGYRRKEQVQSTAAESRFIFHPFPRQQTLHSPCLLPVSPLPHLLLAPPLPVFAERLREPGQLCSPELCARGCAPTKARVQHGGGLAVPPQALQGCCPPAVPGAGSRTAGQQAVAQQGCPAGCHEPVLAAAV